MIKKFFKDYLWDVFFVDSSWGDKILGIMCVSVIIAFVYLIIFLGYKYTDDMSSKIYQSNGIVVGGAFEPAHIVCTGKAVFPTRNRWYLNIKVKDGLTDVYVSENFYENMNINDSVKLQYTKGVFSSNIYPTLIDIVSKK